VFKDEPLRLSERLRKVETMDEATPRHTKRRFYDVCVMYQLDYQTLQFIFFPDLWRIHRFHVDMIAPLAKVSEEVKV
jgi:hypothetical protein